MTALNNTDKIKLQEQLLKFDSFSNADALKIGLALIDEAKNANVSIAIEIFINNCRVFQYLMPGTGAENNAWMRRKRNVVNYFQTSSLLQANILRQKHQDVEKDLFLDPMNYAFVGGGFPINVGGIVVGCICVSNLVDTKDHQIIVDVLAKLKNIKDIPVVE